MSYETLSVERDPRGVINLTLNLPDKRNAMSAQMIDDLTNFATSMADDSARVVVLRGAGSVFCAGGDLGWMKAQIDADRATRMFEARKLAMMLNALNTMPKPLIGLVHGGAFGGGIGLMSVCDYVIADKAARFGLTETRLGLIPATISPYVIARMGEGMARRVFMSARIFDAEEAQTLGLAAEVVDFSQNKEVPALEAQITPYLAAAPGAVAAAKRLARSMGAPIDESAIDRTIEELADIWEGEEADQGIQAFFSKTSPPWRSGEGGS